MEARMSARNPKWRAAMAKLAGHRRRARGEQDGRTKLTPAQVAEIRARYAAGGVTQAELARRYGVVQAHVSRIVRGEVWEWLDE